MSNWMYHIGFDRILVFCVDIPEWKQNNFRKKCGRILKVKLIFNRKSPDLPLSTSVHCVDILFEGVFLFICLFCLPCFSIFYVQIQEKQKGFHPILAWEADIGQWAAHPLLPFLWRLFISTNFPLWAQFFQNLSHN